MKRILFDLEGNGLLPEITKVHCIAAVDVDTGAKAIFGPKEIEAALEYLSTGDVLIAHNGLDYDFAVLEKLYSYVVPFHKKLDTLVLARLIFPDVRSDDGEKTAAGLLKMGEHFGRHTLRAWGLRLGIQKGDFEGPWDKWTQAMQDYCVQDVDTSLALWRHLNPDAFSQAAILLEHRTAVVCRQITRAGWPFDLQKAGLLHSVLVDERDKLEKKLAAEFSGWVETETFVPKRDNKTRGYKKGVPFEKRIPITFNPNSRPHIARALKERGWVPTEFLDSGQPKLDEEVIENIAAEFPQAADISRYLMIMKRIGQLADGDKAWLKFVGDDLCIHGEYNPMGTVTSRAAHFRPNLGQVPAVASPYGKECRELFHVPDGWEQVGADMEGLEIRALCHYLTKYDGGAFMKVALEGDIHWVNVCAMGFVDDGEPRDRSNLFHTVLREQGAKRFFYAWLYGCGNEKAGRILLDVCRAVDKVLPVYGKMLFEKFFKGNRAPGKLLLAKAGGELKQRFLKKLPALAKLVWKVRDLAEEHKAVPGLDKRRIPIRSSHAALNTLLQSAGAILCKQWLCDFYDAALAEGLRYGWDGDFVILGWIHDEIQIACRNGLGEQLGRLLTSTARRAGEPTGFRVRLDSNYKCGHNWADTH